MNHILQPGVATLLGLPEPVSAAALDDPIAAATRAIEAILARAHEAGQEEAVRLLHAVTALLSAAPRQ